MLFSLHRYIVTSLHRYIVTSLHRYIVTSLHRYIVTSLHRYIVTSLHRYIVTSLHRYIVTSLHRYHLLINLITPPAPRLISGGSKRANALYRFITTWFCISEKTELKISDMRFATKRKPYGLSALYQIRTRFEHGFFTCTNNKAFIIKSPLLPYLKLFLHPLLSFLRQPSFLHPLLSFLRQPSFPRRRESRKHLLTKIKLFPYISEKTKSKSQTCGLLQSVSFQLPHCIKSELVLNWFSHYSRTAFHYLRTVLKNCISYLFYFFHRLSFLRPLSFHRQSSSFFRPLLSFLRQPSFPRRRESRKSLLCDKVQRGLFACYYFMRIGEKPSQNLKHAVYRKSVSQRLPLCVKSELVLNWFFPLYQRNSLLSDIDRDNAEQESIQIKNTRRQ